MPKRALLDHRPWLLAAVLAAIVYYLVKESAIGGVWIMLIKGGGAAFLALYALNRGPGRNAKILAAFLGLCALGDMGIQLLLELGGALFFVAHLAALTLFLRNPRPATSSSQKALAAALLLGTPFISWLVSGNWQVAVYALALGGMAASAWMSRFPRYRVGVGAVLFVISDWLIFAGLGVLEGSSIPDWLVWPLYFCAQLLIATGVVQTLRGEHPESGGYTGS